MEVVLYRGISCHIDLNSRDINMSYSCPQLSNFNRPLRSCFKTIIQNKLYISTAVLVMMKKITVLGGLKCVARGARDVQMVAWFTIFVTS